MRLSGFTFVRDAETLGYPVEASIRSILPLCDEFVVVLGRSSDRTEALLERIGSPKLRILRTEWDPELARAGAVYALQTDIGLHACRGDWAFYLQADEVLHERFLPVVEKALVRLDGEPRVEGLLFDFLHFFGDYRHVQTSHNWYGREVRLVRTGRGIHAWHDAQGFRRWGRKLRVAHSGACIFHYGWVHPCGGLWRKAEARRRGYGLPARSCAAPRGHGRLRGIVPFRGTHPETMRDRIGSASWSLRPSGETYKHDRLGVRLLSFVENRLVGRRIGERRNYVWLRGYDRHPRGLAWRRWVDGI
ncbi:MAG: hypothetical protein KatS3mg076_0176 [Candidatus Binatia bacterium]|nr:MAG: hypothetical protein KatS3mg076_0176 [Candidatus Binatia bacterium]